MTKMADLKLFHAKQKKNMREEGQLINMKLKDPVFVEPSVRVFLY